MLQMKKMLKILIGVIVLMSSSCAHKNYLQRFPSIDSHDTYEESQGDVTLSINELNSRKSKSYFGVDLPNKGYIPLHIQINNNGPFSYVIRPSYLDIYPAAQSEIAEQLHYNTSQYIYYGGAAALLFWWPATIWVAQGGYDMYCSNKQIDSSVERLSFTWNEPEIIIHPYERFERFIFVSRSEYSSNFRFRLYNQDEKQLLSFLVDLKDSSYTQ